MKNICKKAVLSLAAFSVIFNMALAGTVVSASAEDYFYPVVEETTPFSGVRVTGINERVQNILGVGDVPGNVSQGAQLYKHLWSVDGKPSGIVNLNLAVEVSDWSQATAMRIRIKSNKLPDAYETAQDNNIAIGYGVKSEKSDKIVLKMDKPYSGGLSFNNRNGSTQSSLFFINDQIPYFSMGRHMNTYVTGQLNDTTFGNVTDYVQSTPNGDTWYTLYNENIQQNIFDYLGEYDLSDESIYTGKTDKDGNRLVVDSAVDMTQVRFVFIRFEPQNYSNMCFDVGNVEILVNGEWITAVDMSKTRIAEKKAGETWYQAITGMKANECILDPTYESGATTAAFKIETIEKTPCGTHTDNNGDGTCERCFEAVPHMFTDIFPIGNKDGLCDSCGKPVCGEDVCVDENKDGGCDVCGHNDYIEEPEPDDPQEPGEPDDPEHPGDPSTPGGDDKPADKKSGCGGSIAGGGIVFAVSAVVACVVKRKNG